MPQSRGRCSVGRSTQGVDLPTELPIDETRLGHLRATRAGRVALGGFEYQRAFAVLRLAAMAIGKPVQGATEVPVWLRYEWAEDLDELAADGGVVLWQCKHGEGFDQPAKLAEVLEGFAPKWLWTPAAERHRLRFRLVTSTSSYATHVDLPGPVGDDAKKALVKTAFTTALGTTPGGTADRARWQADADAAGHGTLFEALWAATNVLYVSGRTAPSGLREAEDRAVTALAWTKKARDLADAGRIVPALQALLTTTPPGPVDAAGTVARPAGAPPRPVLAYEVDQALFPYESAPSGRFPFTVVDRTLLVGKLAEPPGAAYVARRPEWSDVVRGRDAVVRFLERGITGEVERRVRELIAASSRGEGRLRVQLLTGAPGAGKSTLALRVAARLVLDGACVVVDARHPLGADEPTDAIVDGVLRLAKPARPVLLLLDDPLTADTGWPAVLRTLGREAPPVVALAATPDFLFDRHGDRLRGVDVSDPITVERPTPDERADLASLYPEADAERIARADEELLIVAMEAAAGTSFDRIVAGIWTTLNHGEPVPAGTPGSALRWEVAAFAAVCFFHRAYVPFPEPLLRAFLATRTDVVDAVERLADLREHLGWRVFRVEGADGRWTHVGGSVATMHARVAHRAWELRPAKGWDVGAALAAVSADVPTVARPLGIAIGTLAEHDPEAGRRFSDAVVTAWIAPGRRDNLETRYLAEFESIQRMNGVATSSHLAAELRRRLGELDEQSWLAGLALFYGSTSTSGQRRFSDPPRPSDVIGSADFSLAPSRASQLASAVRNVDGALDAFKARLCAAVDGRVPWTLDQFLMDWLLSHAGPAEIRPRLDQIRTWLAGHPDAGQALVAFLKYLSRFPTDAKAADFEVALAWSRTHDTNMNVRSALIALLAKRRHPELARLLTESLATIGSRPNGYGVASAALAAASSLPAAQSRLAADWLLWAAEVLASHVGERRADTIAVAVPRPHEALARYWRQNRVPADDRAHVGHALRRSATACARWCESVGRPPLSDFRR